MTKQLRQQRTLERLQVQLQSGVKTKKGTHDEKVPLTSKDVNRIESEISTLKKVLK